jgi:hypothetical protein
MALPQMTCTFCETTHELCPDHPGKVNTCLNREKWPVGRKPTPTKFSHERTAATEHADLLLLSVIEKIFSQSQNLNRVYVPCSLFAHLKKIRTDSERYGRFSGSVRGYNIAIMDKLEGKAFIDGASNGDAKVVLYQQENDSYVILWRERMWYEGHSLVVEADLAQASG